ncbi:MAG: hypothetical protein IT529_19305 [Burkholderiales bacterium]|nr:hypothetical protein [Burkholderiales bacterium]
MSSKPCGRCRDWATSPEVLPEVLGNRWSACDGCTHERHMKAVTEQYQTRRPRWWMVGNVVVVPIWMVEVLKTRKTI